MKERRAYVRVPIISVLHHIVPDSLEVRKVPLQNIGGGGLNFLCRDEFREGEAIEVEFTLPGDDAPICADGVVMWSNRSRTEKGLYEVGLRFERIDEECSRRIAEHTEREVTKKGALSLVKKEGRNEKRYGHTDWNDSAAKLAHEFRTRLAVIRGAVDNVLVGIFGSLTDEQRKNLQVAADGAERLSKLVEDFMAMFGSGGKGMVLNKERVVLSKLIRRAIQSIEPLAYKEGISITMHVPRRKIEVYCDPARIEQVLLNLFRNSVKFTSRGGSVELTARDMGRRVEVRVADTGVGIPKEKIHEIFTRVEPAETAGGGGFRTSGLGLVIVKDILDAHGTQIKVESALGKGSTFTFALPKAEGKG
ncbi:MAG: ATP-binding protein [bacterium]